MHIAKLKITPLSKNLQNTIILNPQTEMAGQLIKERMELRNGFFEKTPKPPIKLPKWLKGLVNPETLVR